MKKILYLILTGLLMASATILSAKRPKFGATSATTPTKGEFRGTWIQTAFQDRYMRLKPDECKAYMKQMIETLADAGFNAVLFQVRPEGDAFYQSALEPWSRFLTGRQGVAPEPLWDPLAYLITLCHQHQMEFHAWINPYRMTASKFTVVADNHLYRQHPEWFVRYEDRLYLNPALPECRTHVREVVKDIVTRYDVDAIHIDDYFYPYPVPGKTFDDRQAFETYAPVMKIDMADADALGNFRRRSVSILMKSLHDDIRDIKPWVRFGISPFGIYRNASADYPEGSATQGTQCYNDLYADILQWARNGWIDYVIPQLYWEIGHPVADYTTLVRWWNDHVPATCHLYIGQSIERSLDDPKEHRPTPDLTLKHSHFSNKLNQAAEGSNIRGNCFWYAYQVVENQYHVRDFLLANGFRQPTVAPAFTALDPLAPEKVRHLNIGMTQQGLRVSWQYVVTDDPLQRPRYFCVYKFRKGEKVDVTDCSHLLLRTANTSFYDKDYGHSRQYTYVVTSVDAVGNESVPVKKAFKIKAPFPNPFPAAGQGSILKRIGKTIGQE